MQTDSLIIPGKKGRNKEVLIKLKRMYPLYLFLLPAVGATVLFSYAPMFTNIIAFMDYDITNGWMGLNSKFIGFNNFKFLQNPWFWDLFKRTFAYSITQFIFSFPAALILALLINELRNQKFKKVVQTISYMPHFVSWVTVAGLLYIFLSVDPSGAINNVKQAVFGGERVKFMQHEELFLPILVLSQIWKETGWGTILYLAAIAGIDPGLYEAARIDGASRFRQAINITLPGILPTTAILLIFAVGGLGGVSFDQIYNLSNPVIASKIETINIFIYRSGVKNMEYATSTAVGLFQGLISFVLIQLSNYGSKKLSGTGLF